MNLKSPEFRSDKSSVKRAEKGVSSPFSGIVYGHPHLESHTFVRKFHQSVELC